MRHRNGWHSAGAETNITATLSASYHLPGQDLPLLWDYDLSFWVALFLSQQAS